MPHPTGRSYNKILVADIFFPSLQQASGPLTYGIGAMHIQRDCCPQRFQLQYGMIDLLSAYDTHLSEPQYTPSAVPATFFATLTPSAVQAPRSEPIHTVVHTPLARMMGVFFRHRYSCLPIVSLVNAGIFNRAVSVEDVFYIAVTGDADINTTYNMGTVAIVLHAALLWPYTSPINAVGECASFSHCC